MARQRVWFKADYREFREFMLSEQMRDVTTDVAKDIKALAKARTPLGDGENGHMRDKYDVEREGGIIKVNQAFRVMVHIENSDPESALVEFGSKHNERTRMLGSAGAFFGDFKHGKGEGPFRSDGTF